ncbi:hypothetical protein BBFL7_00861 [Flavobacteria bacterium BBFL7]|nr:hypothetical protein BBFL7_00861 [Flavobacteria bacterium BBFL7]
MYSLAIIGLGPRGLYALECLMVSLSRKRDTHNPKVALIESQQFIGCGSAWNIHQPDANTINISDRDLKGLPERSVIKGNGFHITAFPSFIDWVKVNYNHQLDDHKDTYFNRNVMGKYLHLRAKTIVDHLVAQEIVSLIKARATSIVFKNQIAEISFKNGIHASILAQHTLLTTGHLSENMSLQDQGFYQHATQKEDVFYIHNPYTEKAYSLYSSFHRVAIKGMGLSMIDIVHLCIDRLQGKFIPKKNGPFLSFEHNTNDELKIYPFSLDGLPVMPKPIGKTVDNQFNIESSVIEELKKELEKLIEHPNFLNIEDILTPIVDIIKNKYQQLDSSLPDVNIHQLIMSWLLDERVESSLWLDTDLQTVEYLKQASLMACGMRPFTLDYTIGQVWRQLQPVLYPIFTHSNLSPELQSKFIQTDELTKRYSYGPPVERVLQLIALSESGILDFGLVTNPTIKENKDGWILKNKTNEKLVQSMINGVLASPQLKNIDDSLINELFNLNYLEPFHKQLGIKTNEHARVLTESETALEISVLGRNAKGSVYGVDAILECFSPKVMAWANQFTKDYI